MNNSSSLQEWDSSLRSSESNKYCSNVKHENGTSLLKWLMVSKETEVTFNYPTILFYHVPLLTVHVPVPCPSFGFSKAPLKREQHVHRCVPFVYYNFLNRREKPDKMTIMTTVIVIFTILHASKRTTFASKSWFKIICKAEH